MDETGREEKQMQAGITEFAIATGDWCLIPWDHLKSLIKCVLKPPATWRMKGGVLFPCNTGCVCTCTEQFPMPASCLSGAHGPGWKQGTVRLYSCNAG